MKKEEFLAELAAELRDLSKEDIARSLEYYSEMIDERVEDGMSVEDAVAGLGGAETAAQQILAELPRERRSADGERGGDAIGALAKKLGTLGERIGALCDVKYTESAESGADRESTFPIAEPFTALAVRTDGADVRILRSGDGRTRVVTDCEEADAEVVTVRDGVLTVLLGRAAQERNGVEKSFFGLKLGLSDGGSVTVYLADRIWESVSVKTLSGEIEAEDLSAGAVTLASRSGDVSARHLTVSGRLSLESMSGDLNAGDLTAGELSARSMSGDVDVGAASVGAASFSSRSGDIDLSGVCAQGALGAESVSGDVSLHRCDGRDVQLRSVSGDIDGTLLTPKAEFRGRSVSGDIRLPQSGQGIGCCAAESVSGDVSIRIAP